MILSFLLLCLSISLKIVALTARVGLNAAVATGIGLYEVDRLRRRARPGRD